MCKIRSHISTHTPILLEIDLKLKFRIVNKSYFFQMAICIVCKKEMMKKNLARHKRTTHAAKVDRFDCRLCERTYTNQANYDAHFWAAHEDEFDMMPRPAKYQPPEIKSVKNPRRAATRAKTQAKTRARATVPAVAPATPPVLDVLDENVLVDIDVDVDADAIDPLV